MYRYSHRNVSCFKLQNMISDVIIALISALVGTYCGTFFLSKRQEAKIEKIRKIAIRALNIIIVYAKNNGTYINASQEFNAKLNVAEKRAVIVALHKLGIPIQMPVNAPFDIRNVRFAQEAIDMAFIKDAIIQVKHGFCDHLFYEDPDKYFSENIRIYSLRYLAKRFVNEMLSFSAYNKEQELITLPDSWLTSYSYGERKALWIFRCQVTTNIYFLASGKADPKEMEKLCMEIDTGLWDNYLLWLPEAYENISSGTNLSNKFLQMANNNGNMSKGSF